MNADVFPAVACRFRRRQATAGDTQAARNRQTMGAISGFQVGINVEFTSQVMNFP